MIDKIFAYSLIAGFLFTLSIFLTTGKLRILRARPLRLFRRIRRAKKVSQAPWAGPLFVGMFLTLFGSSGLVVRTLLRTPAPLSLVLALVIGVFFAGAGLWLLKRYFAVTANEVKGNPLTGVISQVEPVDSCRRCWNDRMQFGGAPDDDSRSRPQRTRGSKRITSDCYRHSGPHCFGPGNIGGTMLYILSHPWTW